MESARAVLIIALTFTG